MALCRTGRILLGIAAVTHALGRMGEIQSAAKARIDGRCQPLYAVPLRFFGPDDTRYDDVRRTQRSAARPGSQIAENGSVVRSVGGDGAGADQSRGFVSL